MMPLVGRNVIRRRRAPSDLAHEAERSARRALERGCADDVASSDRLFACGLAVARRELQDCLAGAGGLGDPTADSVLRYRAAQEIAARCAESVCDSANVRFRARFRMYAEAVWEAESRLVARPRKVALPRLDVSDVPTPVPPARSSCELVDAWVRELAGHLRSALQREVELAKDELVRRAAASLARSRAARALTRR